MPQADFTYAMAADGAGLPLSVSIFADCDTVREAMREDAHAVGLRVGRVGTFDELAAGDACVLGELVLVDCPEGRASAIATLARLDSRAAHSGAKLMVSTRLDALDAVFGCCAQSSAEILVNPRRTERVLALGHLLASSEGSRLREFSEDDRSTMLRLTERLGEIAERLDRLDRADGGWGQQAGGGAFRFESPADAYRTGREFVRKPRPALPDPRRVRAVIARRRTREQFFDAGLFADPAWDMLLDLTAARVERQRVSVTSLCIASGVPPTTALRWIGQMVDVGLFERIEDDTDRRRAFIELSDKGVGAMAHYFAETGDGADFRP